MKKSPEKSAHRLFIRISENDKCLLKIRAKESGHSLSSYVLASLKQANVPDRKSYRDLFHAIRRIHMEMADTGRLIEAFWQLLAEPPKGQAPSAIQIERFTGLFERFVKQREQLIQEIQKVLS
ncbi:hypothetical protein ACLOAU_04470 [Niabella sp. CJ426]|uniref:hypothetical protein n=1 Tax=Niabella sp. CJ426 TaxID=3393740 RepID=UPI003D018933